MIVNNSETSGLHRAIQKTATVPSRIKGFFSRSMVQNSSASHKSSISLETDEQYGIEAQGILRHDANNL